MVLDLEELLRNISCGTDGFPTPGELIRHARRQLGMTQEQLGKRVGWSRSAIARAELEGYGLDSMITRRRFAEMLGIPLVYFGIMPSLDIRPSILYDTFLLRKTLDSMRDAYFASGRCNLNNVDEVVVRLLDISSTLAYKNEEIKTITAHFVHHGILVARECQNYVAVDRYTNLGNSLAVETGDNLLHRAILGCAADGAYEQLDFKKALALSDEACAIKNVPEHLHGMNLLSRSLAKSALGDKTAIDDAEEALGVTETARDEEDKTKVKFSVGYCHLTRATVFKNLRMFAEAEDAIDEADENVDPDQPRRQCYIRKVEAEVQVGKREFDGAATSLSIALPLARTIQSTPLLSQIAQLTSMLPESRSKRKLLALK